MTKIIFMRHGKHTVDDCDPHLASGLTVAGYQEMITVGEQLRSYPGNLSARTVGNERSLASVVLALNPDTPSSMIGSRIISEREGGRVVIDDRLQYKSHNNLSFQEAVDEAFFAGSCLRFFVRESDGFMKKGASVSTYSVMAGALAEVITDQIEDALLCAREFFYPSLRSKLTSLRLGTNALAGYVDYYCAEVERAASARMQTQWIESEGGAYRLIDDYGELEFDHNDLMAIRQGRAL